MAQEYVETSTEKYRVIGKQIGKVANSCGIEIPRSALSAMDVLAVTIRLADHKIDSNPDNQSRRTQEAYMFAYLCGSVDTLPREYDDLRGYPSLLREKLTSIQSESRGIFLRSLEQIFHTTEALRTTTDAVKFAELTRQEGALTGELFLSFIPSELRSLPNFRNVTAFVRRGAMFGNSMDTLFDWSKDKKNGETTLAPSLRGGLTVLLRTLPDGLALFNAINTKAKLGFVTGAFSLAKDAIDRPGR